MFEQIVVPLDSSPGAEYALPIAAHLARASGGRLVVVRLISSPTSSASVRTASLLRGPADVWEELLTEARHYLARVRHRQSHELRGIPIVEEVTPDATTTLLSQVRQRHNDLIVVSSHQAHGLYHWTLGGMMHEKDPVPVLLLNETEAPFLSSSLEHPLRVLIPLDGSFSGEAVLSPALQLISGLATSEKRCEVHLLHVLKPASLTNQQRGTTYEKANEQLALWKAETALQNLARRWQQGQEGVVITCEVRVSNDIAGTIVNSAEPPEARSSETGMDLIVMAAYGQHAGQQLMLGDVTERVLSMTRLPVLLIRPPQQERQAVQVLERRTLVAVI